MYFIKGAVVVANYPDGKSHTYTNCERSTPRQGDGVRRRGRRKELTRKWANQEPINSMSNISCMTSCASICWRPFVHGSILSGQCKIKRRHNRGDPTCFVGWINVDAGWLKECLHGVSDWFRGYKRCRSGVCGCRSKVPRS